MRVLFRPADVSEVGCQQEFYQMLKENRENQDLSILLIRFKEN